MLGIVICLQSSARECLRDRYQLQWIYLWWEYTLGGLSHLCHRRTIDISDQQTKQNWDGTYLSLISTDKYVNSLGKVPGMRDAFRIYSTEAAIMVTESPQEEDQQYVHELFPSAPKYQYWMQSVWILRKLLGQLPRVDRPVTQSSPGFINERVPIVAKWEIPARC